MGGCVLIAGMEIALCIGSIVDASTTGATTVETHNCCDVENVVIRSK